MTTLLHTPPRNTDIVENPKSNRAPWLISGALMLMIAIAAFLVGLDSDALSSLWFEHGFRLR